MSAEGKGIMDALASLGTAITSPAKLVFVGYVVLAATGRVETSAGQFLGVAAIFFLAEIVHDDYVRILLNRTAELRAAKARKAAGL